MSDAKKYVAPPKPAPEPIPLHDSLTDILPCKPGDTVYIPDRVDCMSGECADVCTGKCRFCIVHTLNDPDVETCRMKHGTVRCVDVESISAVLVQGEDEDTYGAAVTINGEYVFDEADIDCIKRTADEVLLIC